MSLSPDPAAAVRLPEAARARVLALAADTVAKVTPGELPATLRHVASFTPARRARLAAGQLGAALESDPSFRVQVAAVARAARPELAAAVEEGHVPPAAAPEDVAALAYVLRPPGWELLVAGAAAELDAAGRRAAAAAEVSEARRLQAELEAERAARRTEREALRTDLEAARADLAALRRQVKAAQDTARRAEGAARRSADELAAARDAATAAAAEAEAAARRQRARERELEAAVEGARRAARESRAYDDTRVWLLLDAIVAASRGLQAELAVPPAVERPADRVGAALGAAEAVPAAGVPVQGRGADDPGWLDALLAVPRTHLVVDGYNVSKRARPDLPLDAQRNWLVAGLRALAARTRAEVTCVFDGTDLGGPVPGVSGRGVRVQFSRAGRTADEVIAALVAAEPAGRPLVVVSSDREVAESAERQGAYAVASAALVGLLDRG